ncbi:hypothetical protein KY284_004039 [Solanum tuberosum]|nr:hypothetical protein KY284_004039 [Solanum tuberosum]
MDYTREQGQKENFTPIGESYTSLLRKLVQLRLVKPVNPYFVNPNARGFDPTVICEYHANTPGHSTENYWTLKRVIEKLIEDKVIEIRNEEAPNVTNNPLPAHNKEHVVGMVDIYGDCEQTCRTKMESRDSKEESSSNFRDLRKLTVYVPGTVKRREVPLNGPKLYILVNQFSEGKPIPQPHLSSASVMVVSQMVQNGYEPGKGLGLSLSDRKWAKDRKRNVWNLLKPIPQIAQAFIKFRGESSPDFSLQNDVDEMCQGIKEMFYDGNMTYMGEGTSHMDVLFVGPNVQLNNWEVTHLPTRKVSW